MLKYRSRRGGFALLAILLVALSGCGGGGDGGYGTNEPSGSAGSREASPPEPVKLQVYVQNTVPDDVWNKVAVEPVAKKYPYITLEKRNKTSTKEIHDLVAAGYVPDILWTGFNYVGDLQSLKIPYALDDLLKAGNVNVNIFEPVVIGTLRGYDSENKLEALPLYINKNLLWYNKEIFDRFGVPYPKDGLTWGQAVDLSRRLTRNDGGTQYFGLGASWSGIYSQLSPPTIDKKTNKALVNSDPFKEVFTLFKNLAAIPGMTKQVLGKQEDLFMKDRTLAMSTGWISGLGGKLAEAFDKGSPVHFDVATLPYFPEKPNVGMKVDSHMLMLNSQSPNKQAAFDVMTYLTTSAEVQSLVSRGGRMPVIQNESVLNLFAADLPFAQGTRLREVTLKTVMAPLFYHPLEEAVFDKPMNKAYNSVILDNVDVNTALRTAETEMNQLIAEELSKK